MSINQPADNIYETVSERLESPRPVTLDECNKLVITEHVNEWSHEDCYNVLDTDIPRLDFIELGHRDDVPQCIETQSGTDIERRLRYQVAVELVERVLDQYDDPVVNYDLRLHG